MASGPTEAAITEALRSVMDPELRKDLVTLGLAKNVEVRDGTVSAARQADDARSLAARKN